ncbi:O-antigen ligase family protein [Aerococcaceae bacterium DSM 111022]|nr:O-antigen ligase family protein [Aerococcaceae bacterium DSM 111022]
MQTNQQTPTHNTLKTFNWLIVLLTIGLLLPFFTNIIVVIFVLLSLLWLNRKTWLQDIKQLGWLNVFVIFNLITSAVNQNMLGILLSLVFLLLGLLFVYYRRYITAPIFLLILKIFLVGSIILAIYAFIVYAYYSLTHGYGILYVFKYAAIQTRAEATFFNANYYGLYCVFMVLTAIYFLLKVPTKRWRIISIIAIIANLVSIILTASRFFPVTLIVAVVMMLIFVDKRWAYTAIALGAAVILALIIKPELMPRLENLDYAFEDRFDLWDVGLSIFKTSPLVGRGAMSYQKFYYLFTDDADMHAHSLYVDTLANYGIIGIILILIIFWPLVKSMYQLFKKKALRPEFGLLFGFIVNVFFHGIMDFAVFWVQTGLIFLMIILVPNDVLEDLANHTAGSSRDYVKQNTEEEVTKFKKRVSHK